MMLTTVVFSFACLYLGGARGALIPANVQTDPTINPGKIGNTPFTDQVSQVWRAYQKVISPLHLDSLVPITINSEFGMRVNPQGRFDFRNGATLPLLEFKLYSPVDRLRVYGGLFPDYAFRQDKKRQWIWRGDEGYDRMYHQTELNWTSVAGVMDVADAWELVEKQSWLRKIPPLDDLSFSLSSQTLTTRLPGLHYHFSSTLQDLGIIKIDVFLNNTVRFEKEEPYIPPSRTYQGPYRGGPTYTPLRLNDHWW